VKLNARAKLKISHGTDIGAQRSPSVAIVIPIQLSQDTFMSTIVAWDQYAKTQVSTGVFGTINVGLIN